MKIGRVLRTAGHLEPQQLAWRAVHELKLLTYRAWPGLSGGAWKAALRCVAGPAPLRIATVDPALLARERVVARRWAGGEVEYHGLAGDRFDWRAHERSRLWRYEHHYHSELPLIAAIAAADRDTRWAAEARGLVESWRASNPLPAGDGWEPYPVARRILNWSLGLALQPELHDSLASPLGVHLRFLRAHLERHLLGNHLICDAAALMAGGAVIRGWRVNEIARYGEQLLATCLRRQILHDGGYAERTVQYHAIVLRDVLLAIALTRARGRDVDASLVETAGRMTEWLRRVTRRGAPGPWINDAAPGSCPPLDEVLSLGAALGIGDTSRLTWLGGVFGGHALIPEYAPPGDHTLPDTGWTFVREGGHELLFDHGPIGPEEQPGHGHSDALSYELVWDGVPIVTDSGITTYELGAVRDFERSARAHATVTVDGEGPDELWASFRVGGRARVTGGLERTTRDGVRILAGRVEAWQGWIHRRRVLYWPGEALVVLDRVSGASGTMLSRIPVDAACRIENGIVEAAFGPLQLIVLRGWPASPVAGRLHPREGWTSDGFSRPRPRPSIPIHADGAYRVAYAIAAPGRAVILAAGACTIRGANRQVCLPLEEDA